MFAASTRQRSRGCGALAAILVACALAGLACNDDDEHGVTPVSADAFYNSVGVSIHMSFWDTVYGQADRVAGALADLGVRHVRDGMWHSTVRDWNRRLYDQQAVVARRGMKFTYGFDLRPESGTVSQRLGVIAGRLAGTAEAIEGPNEPDLYEAGDWLARLRRFMPELYDAVKHNPNPAIRSLPVLGPSFAVGGEGAFGGNAKAMDLGNIHPYTGCQSPTPAHLRFVAGAYAPVSGGKKWWATEAGFNTALNSPPNGNVQPPCDERTGAVYTLRTLLEHFKFGIARTFLYELIDLRPDPGKVDAESNFGLLRNDFSPKPAFTAVKNLLRIVGSSGPSKPRPTPFSAKGCRSLLIERGDGTYLAFLWRLDSVWDRDARRPIVVPPKRVKVSVPDASWARLVRPLDSTTETPVALRGHQVELDLGGDPVALHLGTGG
jgi:hypothetical protein